MASVASLTVLSAPCVAMAAVGLSVSVEGMGTGVPDCVGTLSEHAASSIPRTTSVPIRALTLPPRL